VQRKMWNRVTVRCSHRQSCLDQESFGQTVLSSVDAWRTPAISWLVTAERQDFVTFKAFSLAVVTAFLKYCHIGFFLPRDILQGKSGHVSCRTKVSIMRPLEEGELGPHLTQCGQGRGLPACQVSSWSVEPCGDITPTSQTGQDRQDRTAVR